MKIFVFGAGASMDAQHRENLSEGLKAPLMRELFLERYYPFAQEVGLPANKFHELQTQAGDNVESYLTKRWEEVTGRKSLHYQEAENSLFGQLVFYMWRLLLAVSTTYNPDEKNSYRLFINKIFKDEDYGFINFNYDTFLDKAIKETYGKHFSSLEDYFSFDYIKPHGSVNWLMGFRVDDVDIPFPGNFSMETRYSVASSRMFGRAAIPYENIKVIDPKDPNIDGSAFHPIISSQFGNRFFYPLVFIPLTSKLYSSVASFNDRIMSKGNEIMEKASEVYLIGYSASDQIIRDMLHHAPNRTRLHVIGRKSSQRIMKNIIDEFEGKLIAGDIYSEGFANYVSEL